VLYFAFAVLLGRGTHRIEQLVGRGWSEATT
jgi:hypothetical protein